MVLNEQEMRFMKYIKAGDSTLEIDNILYTVSGIKIIISSSDITKVQDFFKNNNLSVIEVYENKILSTTYNDYSEFESLAYEQTTSRNIITVFLQKIDKLAVQIGIASDNIKVLSEQVKDTETDVSEIESTLEELLLLIAGDKSTESE